MARETTSILYVCPKCRDSVIKDLEGYSCPTCNARYPSVRNIPVLHSTPYRHLGMEAFRLAEYQVQEGNNAAYRALLDRIIAEIAPLLDARSLLQTLAARPTIKTRHPYSPLQALHYLRRDWTGRVECEQEIADLVNAAFTALDHAGDSAERLLVLGAGTGRLAYSLATRFKDAHALELSVSMNLMRAFLDEGPINFALTDTRNRRAESDVVIDYTATMQGADLSNIGWVIADALRCPYPDESFSTVASIYFSDVIPPSRLLSEASRVLQPEGTFLHVGPLGYQFKDAAEHWTAERWLAEVGGYGMEVVYSNWVSTTYHVDNYSLFKTYVDNFILACRKR